SCAYGHDARRRGAHSPGHRLGFDVAADGAVPADDGSWPHHDERTAAERGPDMIAVADDERALANERRTSEGAEAVQQKRARSLLDDSALARDGTGKQGAVSRTQGQRVRPESHRATGNAEQVLNRPIAVGGCDREGRPGPGKIDARARADVAGAG